MRRIKLLFVDDEEDLVSTLIERLLLRDIEAEGVTDGEEAVRRVRENDYDVVILDVKMPGLGGLEIMKLMQEEKPDLPVILISGHGTVLNGEDSHGGDAFDYLMKPVDIEELIAKARQAAASRKEKRVDG
jgi:DNA-binding NtrC family response regulator